MEKIEKLELKHLCGYLPHGLKCQYEGIINGKELSEEDKRLSKIDVFSNEYEYAISPINGLKIAELKEIKIYRHYWTAHIGIYRRGLKTFVNGYNFKPLLLPLSALTEPIEDGTVPIVEAAKIAYKWQKWDEKRINKNNGVLEGSPYDFWFSEEKREFMLCDGGGYLHINNQLQLFEYLYSIHADIYGLIPAGLAIDKRTVKL